MTTLEQEILEIINETIGGKYIGRLKVLNDDGVWTLYLYMNQEQSPIQIGRDGSWEEFKQYVQKEIQTRKMEKVSYWTAIQELPSNICKDGELEPDYDNVIIT